MTKEGGDMSRHEVEDFRVARVEANIVSKLGNQAQKVQAPVVERV
jgi:hypothetical protein